MISFFLVYLTCTSILAEAQVALPPHSAAVVDNAGLLSQRERSRLDDALRAYKRQHGPQIQVLVVPTTDIEPISDFTFRAFNAWKLGDKDRRDGVLLAIAIKDRKLWIAVGAGLEGELPDLLAKRIIDGNILPYFKKRRFARGIENGLNAIGLAIKKAPVTGSKVRTARTGRRNLRQGTPLDFVFVIVVLLFMIFGRFGRFGGRRRGLLGTALVLGGSGRGGNFGGGFSGGGGGFSSGGGAGGSW